jgi:hypothetical protein
MSARDVLAEAVWRVDWEIAGGPQPMPSWETFTKNDPETAAIYQSQAASCISALTTAGYVVERDWCRDMSAAPRDGTPVVLIAQYPDGVTWSDQYQCWWSQHIWMRWSHRFPPTAWRPLPAPPAAKEPKE